MIAKIHRGRDVGGLLRYLFGPGRANEHVDPRIVAGWDDPRTLEPGFTADGHRDLQRLTALLNQPLAALADRAPDRPVWHCSMRAAPEDRFLSDAEWRRIAEEMMRRTGLAPPDDPEAIRWVAVRHGTDHIHIAATLARVDGRAPSLWNDFYKARTACHAVEEEFGLRPTAPADHTSARHPSRAEKEKATRAGRSETARQELHRKVATAAAASASEAGFFTALRRAGVDVHTRSQAGSDRPIGYAVALAGDRDRSGRPVWYAGGRLAADLTLPKLRRRWTTPHPDNPWGPGAAAIPSESLSPTSARAALRLLAESAARDARNETDYFLRLTESGIRVRRRFSERHPATVTGYALHLRGHRDSAGDDAWYSAAKLSPGLSLTTLRRGWRTAAGAVGAGTELTFAERDAIWTDAARAAAHAARQIRGRDPAQIADIAWATSDVLHVAAAQLGDNPRLRRAANTYDRAARSAHGRIPHPTRSGAELRSTARILGLLHHATRPDPSRSILTALTQLVALVLAIAEARDVQHHAAQRDAAYAAARQLTAAGTTLRAPQPTEAIQTLAAGDFPTSPPLTGRGPTPPTGTTTSQDPSHRQERGRGPRRR